MLISVLVPSGTVNIESMLFFTRNLLLLLPECKIELLICNIKYLCNTSIDDLCSLEKKNLRIKVFDVDGKHTIGNLLSLLFEEALGTYCIIFRQISFEFISSSITASAVLKNNPNSLYLTIDNAGHRTGPVVDKVVRLGCVDVLPLIKPHDPFCSDYPIIWKRVCYFLVGGFNSSLHLSADIDFERKLQQQLPERASRLEVPSKESNDGRLYLFQCAASNKYLNLYTVFFKKNKPPKSYKNTFFFCLSHKQPLYRLPEFVNLIDVSVDAQIGDYHASELLPDFLTWEELLLGELGIFVACDILRTLDFGDLNNHYVSFSYYRKFFATSALGPLISTGDPIHTVFPDGVDYAAVADDIAGRLVAPPVIKYEDKTVLEAYVDSHCLDDYLFATELAVEIGVLDAAELDEFLGTRRFIHWAHAGCTLPLPLFFELVDKLRRLFLAILAAGYRSPIRYIPYQRRWVAYYFERLASFFLLKHYPVWQVPQGHLHNVNLPEEGLGVFNPGGLYLTSQQINK